MRLQSDVAKCAFKPCHCEHKLEGFAGFDMVKNGTWF